MSTFGARVSASMLAAGLSVVAVAKKLEVTPQVVRRWRRDKEMHLSGTHLVELGRILNVRVHWLGTGEGPAERFVTTEYSEADMLKAFRGLPQVDRKLLRDILSIIMKYREG